jgi:hypothetical protein
MTSWELLKIAECLGKYIHDAMHYIKPLRHDITAMQITRFDQLELVKDIFYISFLAKIRIAYII